MIDCLVEAVFTGFACARPPEQGTGEGRRIGEALNVLGALACLLPRSCRLRMLRIASDILDDPVLLDPTPMPPADLTSLKQRSGVNIWRRSRRVDWHVRQTVELVAGGGAEAVPCGHVESTGEKETETTTGSGRREALATRAAAEFFQALLPVDWPLQPVHSAVDSFSLHTSNIPPTKRFNPSDHEGQTSSSTGSCGDGQIVPRHLFKAALWHAIWTHANTSQLTTMPT
ncbi:unnamed protein product [Protopolystoma xenopodis]|uniref:Uncharacterized protein n=1 Tax=Protopolystoma xenopodis TaxID=117903 RepID=A0A448XE77_9PLAT|nr:unnamed protein product [Protopolystoma xenopodis]